MPPRQNRAIIVIILLILGLFLAERTLFELAVFADDTAPSWLAAGAPTLTKLNDLPNTATPEAHNTDCTIYTYELPDSSQKTVCRFATSIGQSDGANIFIGPNTPAFLLGQSSHPALLPPPNDSLIPISLYSPDSVWNYLGFYKNLTRSATQITATSNLGPNYTINRSPDIRLRDDRGSSLLVNTGALAYSSNGEWMVVDAPYVGLLRVNLQTFAIKPFAPAIGQQSFYGNTPSGGVQLAISDDGRYVATSQAFAVGSSASAYLNLYDVSTCTGAIENGSAVGAVCAYKDIWSGKSASRMVDGGIAQQANKLVQPLSLRFVDENSLRFNAVYNYQAANNYQAATFIATLGGAPKHFLGLLGLGDSYISGEGAHSYRDGTDTDIDTCHLSEVSYPFLLGKDSFDSYNSAACSGARITDLLDTSDYYGGQVKDALVQKDRDKTSLLQAFSPGYLSQINFVEQYRPASMLLSVGGNDIGFSKIIKSCVTRLQSCYTSYEDRAELMDLIDNQYPRLVDVYTKLRGQSPASRLYVIGYPQIAKSDGNCAINVRLNSKELQFAAQLISYLNTTIHRAADSAGVRYIDVEHAFDGHRLCEDTSGATIAVNGLTAGNAGPVLFGKNLKLLGSESYHPTPKGQQYLARAIANATGNFSDTMPTPDGQTNTPPRSDTDVLLKDVPHAGRQLNLVSLDNTILNEVTIAGNAEPVNVNGTNAMLQPGANYLITANDDATPLGTATANSDGNISTSITVPSSLAAGYNTLHIYGKNAAGDRIDIQAIFFVASNNDTTNDCGIIPNSGQDSDSDGIDDACDPIIGPPPVRSYPAVVKLTSNVITVVERN